MLKTRILSLIISLPFFPSLALAQLPSPSPSPTPTPTVASPEKVKIFTEEVAIPVSVYDTSGHVALESRDIIVFEDDEATRQSEVWLTALAEETGGLVFHPAAEQQMSAPAEEIAREIDAHFVITYSPKRPLVDATIGEYRSLKVAAIVPGLKLRARRGYVTRSQ